MKFLDYFERHKVGIVGTISLHFILLLVLSWITIPNSTVDNLSEIVMEFSQEEPEKPEQEPEAQQKQIDAASASNSNRAVNEAGPKMLTKADYNQYDSKLDEEIRQSVEEEIKAKLKALEAEVINEQRASGYGYTPEEAEALINSKKQPELEKVKPQEARSEGAVEGATNITYKLENRYDTYIKVPVYMCQYGGEVTINIVVDQQGKVVGAKVDKESSVSRDKCLIDAAIEGARNTRFNASSSAPKLQKGSITFRFVAQ